MLITVMNCSMTSNVEDPNAVYFMNGNPQTESKNRQYIYVCVCIYILRYKCIFKPILLLTMSIYRVYRAALRLHCTGAMTYCRAPNHNIYIYIYIHTYIYIYIYIYISVGMMTLNFCLSFFLLCSVQYNKWTAVRGPLAVPTISISSLALVK